MKIKDICKVNNIDTDKCSFSTASMFEFEPFEKNNSYGNSIITTHNIVLDKQLKNEEIIIGEIIEMLLENAEEPVDDIIVDDISFFHKYENLRFLYSKFISIGSLISIESRVGPGDSIILPTCFLDVDFTMVSGYYNFYFSDFLYDKIIIFRNQKSDYDIPSFQYFHNNENYSIFMCDEFVKHYKVINFKSKKRDRLNKFKKITNEV